MYQRRACSILFSYGELQFRAFSPGSGGGDKKTAYNYYGCYEKGNFRYFAQSPSDFETKYRNDVLSNVGCITCVVVAIQYAPYHQIVIDFDCRDLVQQAQCETKAITYLTNLFVASGIYNAEIYCLAKAGGRDRSAGLHIQVPNVYIARLDYLVLLAQLKKSFGGEDSESSVVDSDISNWCLPLASKGADPQAVYYPYAVYDTLVVGGGGPRPFTRSDLVEKFLNVLGTGQTTDVVMQFPSVFWALSQPADTVVIVSSGEDTLSKTTENLMLWDRDHEMAMFGDFLRYKLNVTVSLPFQNFDWETLVGPIHGSEQYTPYLARFQRDLEPITIDHVRKYSLQCQSNQYNLCQALAIEYGSEVGRILAFCLDVVDLFERIVSIYEHYTPKPSCIIKALIVDVYANAENDDVANAALADVPRWWDTCRQHRSVSALALEQMHETKLNLNKFIGFLLPIVYDGSTASFFDDGKWSQCKGKGVSEMRHLVDAKLSRINECHDEIKKLNEESVKRKRGNPLDYWIRESMNYWADDFRPVDLPRHVFVFRDGMCRDLKLGLYFRPLMCYHTVKKSTLPSIAFKESSRREELYFSSNGDDGSSVAAATWPELSEFLLSVFVEPEVADYFVDTVSSIVWWKEQKTIYFYYGPSSNNGKTTILHVLRKLFGTMASWIQHSTLKEGFKATNPDLCNAAAARLMIVDELNASTRIEATLIKALTGNSFIYVRDLYSSGGSSQFTGSLILSANGLPFIDMTEAIISRFVPIHFKVSFVSDEQLASRNEEHDRVRKEYDDAYLTLLASQLLEVCEGRLRLGENRPVLPIPTSLVKLKQELIAHLDDIPELLQKMGYEITKDVKDYVTKKELQTSLSIQRAKDKNLYMDAREFYQRIKSVSVKVDGDGFFGIAVSEKYVLSILD